MNKELNAAEAVYGFVAWLTTREERTVMSAKDDCAPIAELIKRFCAENNLPEVSDQWPLNLIHPSGEVAVPNAELCGAADMPEALRRSTAADGKTELFNLPGYPLMVRAVDFNRIHTESEMRRTALLDEMQNAARAARAPADSVLEDAARWNAWSQALLVEGANCGTEPEFFLQQFNSWIDAARATQKK